MEVPAPVKIGERIKGLREDKHMSLRVLSKKSGISANALSLIERSRTSPTVSTLIAIAGAFNVSVHEFFSDGDNGKDRYVLYRAASSGHGTASEAMASNLKNQNLNPLFLRLGPNEKFRRDLCFHPGDEFIYCLSGEIECEIDHDKIRLNPGDAITYKAEIPHRLQSVSPSGADVLVVFEVGRLH